jgi:hypothetical protein
MFQPRRGGEDEDILDDELALVEGDDDRRYPAEAWQIAEELFAMAAAAGGRRLSELLTAARQRDPRATELIALSALHAYAPESATPALRAIDDGQPLDDPEFGGHDLLVGPAAST